MDFFSGLFHYITDANKNVSNRVFIVMVFFLLVFIVDNTMGFSYFYASGKKIEQAKELSALINATSDSMVKRKLITLENNVIDRKSIKDQIAQNIHHVNVTIGHIEGRSQTWNIITSSWLFILITIAIAYITLIRDYDKTLAKRLFMTLLNITLMYVLCFFFNWLTAKLPTIWGLPFINYVLNTLFQFVFLSLVAIIEEPETFHDLTKDREKEKPAASFTSTSRDSDV